MELLSVSESGGATSADFRLKDGKVISIAIDKLSDADSKRAKAWNETNKFAKFVEFYIPETFGNEPSDSDGPHGVNYEFLVETPGAFAVDSKSLSITTFPPGSKNGKEKQENWRLSGTLHKHNTNAQYAKLPDGLLLSILREGGEFSRAQIDDAPFEASIEVLTSNKSETATLEFKQHKDNRSEVRSLKGLKIWIEELPKDPFNEKGAMTLVVRVDGPNAEGCILSSSITSDGKPISRLQDAKNSRVSAIIQYRSDIRRQKLICKKPPKTPGLLFPKE